MCSHVRCSASPWRTAKACCAGRVIIHLPYTFHWRAFSPTRAASVPTPRHDPFRHRATEHSPRPLGRQIPSTGLPVQCPFLLPDDRHRSCGSDQAGSHHATTHNRVCGCQQIRFTFRRQQTATMQSVPETAVALHLQYSPPSSVRAATLPTEVQPKPFGC